MYIRQQCLYSFEDALKMQAQTRLENIFITLDLTSFIKKLPVSYSTFVVEITEQPLDI